MIWQKGFLVAFCLICLFFQYETGGNTSLKYMTVLNAMEHWNTHKSWGRLQTGHVGWKNIGQQCVPSRLDSCFQCKPVSVVAHSYWLRSVGLPFQVRPDHLKTCRPARKYFSNQRTLHASRQLCFKHHLDKKQTMSLKILGDWCIHNGGSHWYVERIATDRPNVQLFDHMCPMHYSWCHLMGHAKYEATDRQGVAQLENIKQKHKENRSTFDFTVGLEKFLFMGFPLHRLHVQHLTEKDCMIEFSNRTII